MPRQSFTELITAGFLQIGDGHRAKLSELGGDGLPFLRAGLVSDDAINVSDAERFLASVSIPQAKLSVARDTFVTTKGNSVGRTGYVPAGLPTFVYSPHLSYWRSLDPTRLHPEYLRYWARSADFAHQLHAMAHGTDMAPYLSLIDQRRLSIPLPGIEEQQSIAAVLGALDDKIELNRRMNETLGALTTAVGRNAQASDSSTTMPVSELARYVNGGAYTKGADGKGRPVIRIRELNGGVSDATPRSSIMPSDDQIANDGDLLFSWSGSLDVYRWHGEQAIVNQHIFKVIPNRGFPQWLVHEALRDVMPMFQGIARDKATTMGHIQRGDLDRANVRVPADRAEVDAIIGPMYDLASANTRESRTLAQLRDAILPELISGRMRVGDAPKLAGAAV